jgi:hypothetical protein
MLQSRDMGARKESTFGTGKNFGDGWTNFGGKVLQQCCIFYERLRDITFSSRLQNIHGSDICACDA